MTLTTEETLFVEFLQSFPQFYKKAHEIAENTKGISILPMEMEKMTLKCMSWMISVILVTFLGMEIY